MNNLCKKLDFLCALFASLNGTNDFTPQCNEMVNDCFEKSIKCG